MNNFGLPERTINELKKYFKNKPEIKKVFIYGSRAKGTFKNGSDIDFAIWADNNTNFNKIYSELDDLPTPYKFDVTDYQNISNDNLKKSIDLDGKLFYQKS